MFNFSQKFFAVIFLMVTIGGAFTNMIIRHDIFASALAEIHFPKTPHKAREAISALTYTIDTTVAEKPKFIETYGYLQALLGKEEMTDYDYIRSKSGAIKTGNFYYTDPKELREYAKRIYRLKQAAEAKGIKMLFMGTPDTINEGDGNVFSYGLPVFQFNPDQDTFFNYLREYGVDYLDLRESFRNSGFPLDKMMFKTDHHWTTEASFEGFRALVTYMERLYGAQLDPGGYYRDLNNYTAETHKEIFLGSFGRSAGMVYSGLDDFTVIFPKFENEYLVEYINPAIRTYNQKRGTFKETMYPPSALNITYPYAQSPYYYMFGLNSWTKIINLNNPKGPKLLLIHDSFMQPVMTFMAPLFSEIHTIWPIYDGAENPAPLDAEKYLEDNTFDYVIVELYPPNIFEHGVNFYRR